MATRGLLSSGGNSYIREPISKRFSLVKVKAGEYFKRKNTLSILRIEIWAQRRDWPKWDVLKLALEIETASQVFAGRRDIDSAMYA